MAARAVAAARHALPRAQPQAGVADPVGGRAAQSERHRARLVRRARRTGGSSSRCPDRRARCGRCGPTRPCRGSRRSASGAPVASRTYRLAGIGESQVAELLGEDLLRATNPVVATYARVEAVDVRISAIAVETTSAEALVEAAAGVVLDTLGSYVWATGETTWSEAIGARLGEPRLDARRGRDRHRRERRGPVRRRPVAALRRIDRRRRAGRDGPPVGRWAVAGRSRGG